MYYVQGKHSVVVPVLNDILLKVEAYTHQKFTLNFGYNVSTYFTIFCKRLHNVFSKLSDNVTATPKYNSIIFKVLQ